MIVETKTYRVLTPKDGMWLYNEKDEIISDKVCLGKEAANSDWREITKAEKVAIEGERQSALL